jgi:TPP-dependent trihydroxycyclohexane-1,2-dione (THcHDO) dehydratase
MGNAHDYLQLNAVNYLNEAIETAFKTDIPQVISFKVNLRDMNLNYGYWMEIESNTFSKRAWLAASTAL